MKEATGEMNMTVVTIIAIGAIAAFFWLMWPKIQDAISGSWNKTCIEYNDAGECVKKGNADPIK